MVGNSMKIKCPNKRCLYEWDYKGSLKQGFYTTCPRCQYKVRIKPIEKERKKQIKNDN